MMSGLLIEIVPIGLLLTLWPTRIIGTILLLTSPQPMRKAPAFLAGFASAYLAIGFITLVFFGRTLGDIIESAAIFGAILVVIGFCLLVVAVTSLFMRANSNALSSKWLQRMTSISPGLAFLLGILLACSIRYLLIFLSGVVLIYEARISPGQSVIALLVLVTLALLCQVLPVALYMADSRQARAQLSALMRWLIPHSRMIMTVLSLVLGIIFLVLGLSGLIPVISAGR